jgi:hypothetical protein
MWDLSIPGDNDHDFYVLVGRVPVLVHNYSLGVPVGRYSLGVPVGREFKLYGRYTPRIDQFNTSGGESSFEIHVYYNGQEIGVYGSSGFFPKHGLGSDVDVPEQVSNGLKGIAIDQMRRNGQLSPDSDIKGNEWERPMRGSSC